MHLHDSRRPGHPGAKGDKEQLVGGDNTPAGQVLRQRQRDRGGRGVGKAVDVDDELVHGQLHIPGCRLDNAHVRLVRNDVGDFVHAQPGVAERLAARWTHHLGGKLEDFRSVHAQVMAAFRQHIGTERAGRTARRHNDVMPISTVGAKHEAQHPAGFIRGLHDNSPRGIAEQHTDRPVSPVYEAAEDFHPHHQDVAVGAGGDELLRRSPSRRRSQCSLYRPQTRAHSGRPTGPAPGWIPAA